MALITGMHTAGCRGERTTKRPRQFFPGMDDQPKYKPQSESRFFTDGQSMRHPVVGTIPFGRRSALRFGDPPGQMGSSQHAVALERMDLLREDDRVYRGLTDDGSYIQTAPIRALEGLVDDEPIPLDLVRSLIERGHDRFNIFCIVCHGGLGDGKGMIGQRWSYPLPNFHDPVYQPGAPKGQDGYLFHVIRNGVANAPGVLPPLRMPSYAEKVSPRDAWSIVLYIRSLQATTEGSITDAPESIRADLRAQRPAPPTPTAQPTGPVAASVHMTDLLQFEPKVVTIKAGQTVEWTNSSFLVHTVTMDPALAAYKKNVLMPAGAEPFDSDRLFPDASYRHTFTIPGTYRYFCKPHESTGMIGEIVVEPAPQ